MNKLIKYILISTFLIIGIGCKNELPYPEKFTQINLTHSPDVVAWSGGEFLGSTFYLPQTRSAQPNENQWGTDVDNGKYKDYPKPGDITEEERDKVLAVFNEKGKESYEPLVDWSNFFVQQVYCGPEGNKMTELACWDPEGHEYTSYPEWNNWQAWTETIYDDIVNNFNNGAYSGNTEQGCMLMFNSSTSNWSFKSTQGGGERFYNWRMEWIDGAYYVGFDFQSNKQGSEANDNELFERDYIYNDWIIKIVPAIGVDTSTPPSTENSTESEDKSDVILHNDEVEVNYALVDEHEDIADLVTKLSIHIRKGTDVKVVIPIPSRYVVESDDFAIFQAHEVGISTGDEKPVIKDEHRSHSLTYSIEGFSPVTLTITFNEVGIIVETSGITQSLIDYLFEENGDGLNFEVWNYFDNTNPSGDENFSREDLLGFMNQATIEFLDEEPSYYINAFGYQDKDEPGYPWGCNPEHATVLIVDSQRGDYQEKFTSSHLNETPYNDIYVKKGVTTDNLHKN